MRKIIQHHHTFNKRCCMCTCIVSLAAQVRLICTWCTQICLRRAAYISANGFANGYRYGYKYGCGYRRRVCIYGPSGLGKISQSTGLLASKATTTATYNSSDGSMMRVTAQ